MQQAPETVATAVLAIQTQLPAAGVYNAYSDRFSAMRNRLQNFQPFTSGSASPCTAQTAFAAIVTMSST
jgi:hypothetical protein